MSTMSVMKDNKNTTSEDREEMQKFLNYCDDCQNEKKQVKK